MHKLIRTFASIVGVLVVASLVLVVLLTTETGTCWLIHHVATHVPGQLTIRRIQGNVFSDLSLYGVDYRTDQQHTEIQHVALSWQPIALLSGTVHLQNLDIQGITCILLEPKETSTKGTVYLSPDASFPLEVVIEEARLDRLDLRHGDSRYVLDYVHLTGRADRNGLWFEQFKAQGKGVHINLRGRTGLRPPHAFQGNLNWSVMLPNGVRAQGECDIRGDIHTVKLTLKLSEPFVLETRGEIMLGRGLTGFSLIGERGNAHWPSNAGAAYLSKNAQHHIKSKTDSYQMTSRNDYTGQNLPTTQHFQTGGRGGLMNIRVENLEAHMLGGTVKLNGHIVWKLKPKWEFTVNAVDIDPSIHWPDWPGKLALEAKVIGETDATTLTVLLHEIKIVGHLLEQPLQATGDLTLRGKRIESGNIEILSGKNQLNVSGTTASHLDLRFDVHVPDPVSLWPELRGRLRGKGILKQTLSNPTGEIALEGNNISYRDFITVQNFDVNLAFSSNDMHNSNARIKMVNLQVNDEVLPSISLDWVGDLKNHRVRADIVSTSACTNVEFEGSCHQDVWEVKVNAASFDPNQYGMWRLRNPVDLVVSNTEIKPFKACWVQEKSSVCAEGFWNNTSGWKAEGDVNAPPLKCMMDLLKKFLKKRAAIQPER